MEEIIIRGGMIADGTGRPMYRADVAVKDGVIEEIGDLKGRTAEKELDASGLIVAPGFFDVHSHSDTSFLKDSSSASKLYQGVTTEISGQCGSSPFPSEPGDLFECGSFDEFVRKFEESDYSMAVNQAVLAGHGSLRAKVIGYEDRRPTKDELDRMKEMLRRDLTAGAWGMSLGLEYAPGFFAEQEELIELAKVVKEFDGLVPCHMRNEGLNIGEALDELLNVGRESGAHVHVSHIKLDNFRVHGSAGTVWEKIDKARRGGVNVTADLYPFTASCTSLSIRCPKWSKEGGSEALVGHLTGARRQEVIEGIRSHYFNAERAETCLINDDAGCWPQIVGKTLKFIAEEYLHTTDYAEAAAEILIRTKGYAGGIFFVMDERDMLYFLGKDVLIGSDGYALPGEAKKLSSRPHPRSFAAVSEFFRLARERRLCSIEEAVYRVTGKAADLMGMKDRGRLLPGMAADITVFDEKKIGPRATYLDSVQLSEGVVHMLVNGGVAMEDGRQTEQRMGEMLIKV